MIISILYLFLAILGLSFLIFIHELGHYWMARRVGMRVDTFAIGFGKPILSWERDGVKWQIGWLLFGGYVKIAGTETEGGVDPYTIQDGFFGKGPWQRIKVAFMGPLVNLLCALLLFTILWISGGRVKSFSEYTHIIGWVDPTSELYADGVRPGDEITAYDSYKFENAKDHLYDPMIAPGSMHVKGFKTDYLTGSRTPFDYKINTYSNPSFLDSNILTAGILNSANYVLYEKLPNGADNPLSPGSPLEKSGIEYNDRIIWVDGKLIFSSAQLSNVLNDGRILLTIKRNGKMLLRRAPAVHAQDLRPNAEFREELVDWQHEAGLNNRKFTHLSVIPYHLTYDCVVENVLPFIDQSDQEHAFPKYADSPEEEPLQQGDIIIAAQGIPIRRSFELLKGIQEKKVNIIVERMSNEQTLHSWRDEDSAFYQNVNLKSLEQIANSIGSQENVSAIGNLSLLKPVVPKKRSEFPMTKEAKAWLEAENEEKRKIIENVEDSEKRQHLLKMLQTNENLLVLGLPNPQDLKVIYNPEPAKLFFNVAREIWRTLEALFSGYLSPKYITGPVGIVQVVQSTALVSIKEGLYWIAAISLNLGILNLLPIPVLDGGTILISFFELITGKRIKQKILEKVIIVFAILLISFFVFLTYNDLLRVFGSIFG